MTQLEREAEIKFLKEKLALLQQINAAQLPIYSLYPRMSHYCHQYCGCGSVVTLSTSGNVTLAGGGVTGTFPAGTTYGI